MIELCGWPRGSLFLLFFSISSRGAALQLLVRPCTVAAFDPLESVGLAQLAVRNIAPRTCNNETKQEKK